MIVLLRVESGILEYPYQLSNFYSEQYMVMATAEARAAWKHTNRSFAKDETKNEQKCPWCSSSSSSSAKSDSFLAPENPAKGTNNHSPNCLLFNPDYDLLMDQKWWLKKPNFVHDKDLMNEMQNSFEVELETLSCGFVHKNTDACEGQLTKVSNAEIGKKIDNPLIDNVLGKVSAINDLGNFIHLDDDLINSLVSLQPKKLSSDLECQWVSSGKSEPWWLTERKDNLASFIAQRSLEHIENCDLPRPQTNHRRNHPSACPENFDHDKFLASFSDQMTDTRISNLHVYPWGSPISGCLPNDSDQSYSCNKDHSVTSTSDIQNNSENTQTRAELLKALHYSQTRAREAEKAAKQAYNDKEQIMTLFFRQASQLFAYKQWLHLLQLENLCLQLKYKNQPISCIFPTSVPWVPYKGKQRNKGQRRAGKRKSRPRYEISKGAIAFALGLSLAGAGLLLGWTMGWLFRAA